MTCSTKKVAWIGGAFVGVTLAVGLIVYFVLRNNDTTTGPIVTVEDGSLRGEWVDAATGDSFRYAAFRWIPFAEPPLGPSLRFKEPRPAIKWEGVRDSTKEGDMCFQTGGGSEDCLYLNVFTPKLPQAGEPLLPVLFVIPGGAFMRGSATAAKFGPDFLVHEDIIVVSTNYRVNAFGFLNFENKAIPGNAALKDVIFALKWVQRNIEKFGGDPQKVTVQGQSAGGALSHWMTLLPQAKGLFRAAIVQSANAMHGWGYGETNIAFAKEFSRILVGREATLEEAAEVAKTASAQDLCSASMTAWNNTDRTAPASIMMTGFQPSPQRSSKAQLGEEPLITRDPESLILSRPAGLPDVPIIFGMTNREWLYFRYSGLGSSRLNGVEAQINNLASLLPQSLIPRIDTQKLLQIEQQASKYSYEDAAEYFKKALFSSTNSQCNDECVLSQFEEVSFAGADYSRLARLRALSPNSQKTYMYRFGVASDYNTVLPQETPEEIKTAATHGDDMKYIFHVSTLKQKYNGEGVASVTLRRMVKMFANFVKHLDPVPEPDSLLKVKWIPYNASLSDSDTFLDIGEELTMRQNEYIGGHEDIPVWLRAFKQYRDNRSI